jgi:hypothetical protein
MSLGSTVARIVELFGGQARIASSIHVESGSAWAGKYRIWPRPPSEAYKWQVLLLLKSEEDMECSQAATDGHCCLHSRVSLSGGCRE